MGYTKKLQKMCLSIAISSFFSCFSYVYQLVVMKKEVPTGECQSVIGIGDYHDKTHTANNEQRIYLEQYLQKLKNGKLIVEDLSSVNNDGRSMCCHYVVNSRGGILGKLADVARGYNIDVDNVEYRYCRVAGIGPLLHNLDKDPHTIPSTASIGLQALKQEVLDEVERVKRYNDDKALNALYVKKINEIVQSFGQLKLDSATHRTIADYCKRFSKNNYVKNLERLCMFDSALIDIKIIHSIVSSPNKKIIVVVAGGSHIEKIVAMLLSLGYKNSIAVSDTAYHYPTVENELSSVVHSSSQSVHPEALDIKILDQFLD